MNKGSVLCIIRALKMFFFPLHSSLGKPGTFGNLSTSRDKVQTDGETFTSEQRHVQTHGCYLGQTSI